MADTASGEGGLSDRVCEIVGALASLKSDVRKDFGVQNEDERWWADNNDTETLPGYNETHQGHFSAPIVMFKTQLLFNKHRQPKPKNKIMLIICPLTFIDALMSTFYWDFHIIYFSLQLSLFNNDTQNKSIQTVSMLSNFLNNELLLFVRPIRVR